MIFALRASNGEFKTSAAIGVRLNSGRSIRHALTVFMSELSAVANLLY